MVSSGFTGVRRGFGASSGEHGRRSVRDDSTELVTFLGPQVAIWRRRQAVPTCLDILGWDQPGTSKTIIHTHSVR